MKRKLSHHALVLTLLAVSLFSITPAHADQIQGQIGTVVFRLTGQANSMNTPVGAVGSATLDLTGETHGDGEGGLVIGNLTGSLQIGSVNYSIFTGNGTSNRLGEFAIFGQSSSGELVLHGIIQHNSTVTTDAPPSRLSSIAYLALSGSMTLNISGNTSIMNVEATQNVTGTAENRSSTETSVNSTQYEYTSSSISNFTSKSEVSNEIATQSTSNTTSLNQTVSYALPGQSNTITQFNSQTITVYTSETVANSTITQTVTTTVANTTITQISSVTISNTTIIVTNSTNSSP